METEKKKKGKNVVSETDKGDHILQRRRVDREGMLSPQEYDLKIPKSLQSAEAIYGEMGWLRMGIATLKTENDDAIETSGKPVSQDKALKTAIQGASDKQREEIAKILGLSLTEARNKIEEVKRDLKKAGFGK